MDVAGCLLPDDRLYDFEHEVWWKPEGDGSTAVVGVMATFGAFAGPFREVVFRPVEGPVAAGRSVATVESVRLTGAVRLPRTAEVVERNLAVVRRPRLLNDAPYGEGWVVRVRAEGGATDPTQLESAARVAPRLEERIRARRIRCWPRTPEVELSEIGLECSAVLVKLNEELARHAVGEAILLVTDDPTSPIEMVRWTDQTGHTVLAHRRDGTLHQFLVERGDGSAARRPRRD
ncbi:MAG TPA: sulfurtransferase TusA family protein [Thermoplasmata archaeon]|nr:sulfurtransferase TusA family protein [Thermoplasmata archaeon]